MFCDLVASTELSQQLDAEDYRAVVRAYQAAAAAAIQPYDGYIAQYLGDGLLVYFGWPQAHEDAAHRAVHASLALLDALGPLHETHLVPRYGVRIAVRIGLHTGLAVIGAMGGGDRSERLAMGDTPNLAARIQGLARPNTVALSAATARLVQGAFALEDLGTQALKGVAEPMPVYRVLRPIETHHDEEETGPGCADAGGAGRGNRLAATALGAGQRGAWAGGAGQWGGGDWQIGPGPRRCASTSGATAWCG